MTIYIINGSGLIFPISAEEKEGALYTSRGSYSLSSEGEYMGWFHTEGEAKFSRLHFLQLKIEEHKSSVDSLNQEIDCFKAEQQRLLG